MGDRIDSDSYVRKVSEDTARYTRDLLRENHRLRALAARLEADGRNLRAELQHHTETSMRERADLESQLAQVETESRQYLEDYLEVEQQNANLANLYVASLRLHSTLIRTEVLSAIEEIIINLVGSEELAIIEIDPQTREPRVALAFGLDARTFDDLPAGAQQQIESCFLSGEIWVRASGDESPLTACIPLAVDGELIGAIAIFRLLQQKTGIEPVDHELFGLLAAHAATALYCSGLHSERLQPVQR
jgi:hypothetical protein